MMDYIWDPEKDRQNRHRHGVALADGISALQDPNAETWIDDRFDYGEERSITLGLSIGGVPYVVASELADDLIRIISVRRAKRHEERWYYEGKS